MPADLVLILGAGASVPYGFPTGNELRHWICDLWTNRDQISSANQSTDRSNRIFHTLAQLDFGRNKVARIGQMLAESKLPSIDRLVFHRSAEVSEMARLLISASLLDSESHDALSNPRADGDWFQLLWSSLTAGRKSVADVATGKLAVFTFNYDRSFEQLLFSACKATFGVDDKVAAEFLAKIHIKHFYGATMKLPQATCAGVKFDCDRTRLHEAVEVAEKEIWLIDDERKRQAAVFDGFLGVLEHANTVTFLGYGFDEINDKNLGLADWSREYLTRIVDGYAASAPIWSGLPRFQATTLGMYEREVISALKRANLSAGDQAGQISTLSKNCYEALREWGTFDLLRS